MNQLTLPLSKVTENSNFFSKFVVCQIYTMTNIITCNMLHLNIILIKSILRFLLQLLFFFGYNDVNVNKSNNVMIII